MPIDLRAKMSGGGSFQPAASSGYQAVSAGASGEILSLSNVDGKDVRLESLASSKGNSPFGESDITVIVDGIVLISGFLAGSSPSVVGVGSFTVQQTGSYNGTSNVNTTGTGYISNVVGKSITVKKEIGSVLNNISYSYSVGK